MKVVNFLKENLILSIITLATIVTSFFNPPSLQYVEFLNFKSIVILFCLMITVTGLNSTRVFKILANKILSKVKTSRGLVVALVFIPTILAIFITNNVAVITFVPFIIVVLTMCDMNHLVLKTIVLCTIGCNLGGLISPIANNQNMFLFAFYELDIFYLIKNDILLFTLSMLLLLGCCLTTKKVPVNTFDVKKSRLRVGKLVGYSLLLLLSLTIVMVTHSYYFWIVLGLVAVGIALIDKRMFKRVNYSVLITFSVFFIFSGNMRSIEAVSSAVNSVLSGNEYLMAIFLTQAISNTPATLLLSGFSDNVYPLIYGLNVGKNGTMIASMSGIFIHKMYVDFENKPAKFFATFTLYAFLFLGFMTIAGFFILF